jgi:hypothetical protein
MIVQRLYTALIAVWVIRHIGAVALLPAEVRPTWVAFTLVWALCAIYLIIGRHSGMIYWLLLALIGLEFVTMGWWNKEGVSMLAWLTLVMAVTEDHPQERLFLVRMLATVVYSFAVITKLNPSWLAGEGVLALLPLHPTLAWTAPAAEIPGAAVAPALLVIGVEGFLAVGLWFAPTRRYAMAVGIVMHTLFIVMLARDGFSFIHLLALNGGLMLCYPAFLELDRSRPPLPEPVAASSTVV